MRRPVISGTKEWAFLEANLQIGCEYDCKYCSARYRMVYTRPMTAGEWRSPKPHPLRLPNPQWTGPVLFPSAHDITPLNLSRCCEAAEAILAGGWELLIVSKPRLACIRALCALPAMRLNQERVVFCFTIGTDDDSILRHWEPGAPDFLERRGALIFAFQDGWRTSVSIEPMLDTPNIERLVEQVRPYVRYAIWFGKMNSIREKVRMRSEADRAEVRRIEAGQTDEAIKAVYAAFREDPLAAWKESIKAVVGLPAAEGELPGPGGYAHQLG